MPHDALHEPTPLDAPANARETMPVASWKHGCGFLGIVAGVALAGFAAQHRPVAGGGLVEAHAPVLPLYLSVTLLNWLLAFYVWRGIRRGGGTVRDLVGGRWTNLSDVFRDLGLAALFWGVLLAAGWAMEAGFGHGQGKSLDSLLPHAPLEVFAWFLTSASAGICEEFVFRGYVQRQFLALSGRVWAAVLGQGVLFGLMHAYQGWKPTFEICLIGFLLGGMAAWRKTLRVGILAHGWHDFWAGWLGIVLRG